MSAVDFSGCRILRLALVAPHRSGIDEDGATEAGILGQEVERILEFEAGAPIHRTADIVVRRPGRDVARTYAGRLKSANEIRSHLEVVKHAHIAVARRTFAWSDIC